MFGITQEMVFQFIVRLMVLFTAMPVHECAHGLVADRLGDDTPRAQGRLTLNPFAHLDLVGSLMIFLTGFGWAKPVEVNTRNFKNPKRDMALTALAGPASNFLMALLLVTLYKLLLGFSPAMRNNFVVNLLPEILFYGVIINLGLAAFNFLPVPPLDGSKIIGPLLPNKLYWNMLRYQRQISIVVMILLFLGLLSVPLNILSTLGLRLLNWLTTPIEWLFR